VLAIAYGPLLAEFFRNQWSQPQYQFFPFVLGAFAWLLWRSCSQSRPREATASAADRIMMIGLLAAAWGLLALAYAAGSPWVAMISAILLVASRFVRVSSGWQVEYLWGIWALLWLMVPLPLGRDRYVVSWLQTQSSRLSSFFLDTLGVHHLMDGNALRLPDKEFFVDEACSGIVSVMSVIACAVIYGIWRNRSPLHVVLLAVAGVLWATLMNVGRITSIAVAHDAWGVDWSQGTSHEILGLIVFSITFLLLVMTDNFLIAALAPIATGSADQAGVPVQIGRKAVAWWDWLQTWGAPQPAGAVVEIRRAKGGGPWSRFGLGLVPLFAFATLAGGQFAVSQLYAPRLSAAPHSMEQALALDAAAAPATVGLLERVDFETQERNRDDISGQYSRVYRYRDPEGNQYLLSCDFPFGPFWHDLTVCYTSVGWLQSAEPVVHDLEAAGAANWGYLEHQFVKPEGSAGLLTYCAFDEHGECLEPPTRSLLSDLWRSLQKKQRELEAGRIFQLQVWTTSAGQISDEQAARARELLLAVRNQIRELVTKSIDGGGSTAKNAG
jgi:exosortase